ncbi:hypothetical protein PF003_g3862 [Phytophthora fragariae]|nr:hypothetical protein PF003_g3862 [Phytophthora fragariae]
MPLYAGSGKVVDWCRSGRAVRECGRNRGRQRIPGLYPMPQEAEFHEGQAVHRELTRSEAQPGTCRGVERQAWRASST